jgi:hypothetical protein
LTGRVFWYALIRELRVLLKISVLSALASSEQLLLSCCSYSRYSTSQSLYILYNIFSEMLRWLCRR